MFIFQKLFRFDSFIGFFGMSLIKVWNWTNEMNFVQNWLYLFERIISKCDILWTVKPTNTILQFWWSRQLKMVCFLHVRSWFDDELWLYWNECHILVKAPSTTWKTKYYILNNEANKIIRMAHSLFLLTGHLYAKISLMIPKLVPFWFLSSFNQIDMWPESLVNFAFSFLFLCEVQMLRIVVCKNRYWNKVDLYESFNLCHIFKLQTLFLCIAYIMVSIIGCLLLNRCS